MERTLGKQVVTYLSREERVVGGGKRGSESPTLPPTYLQTTPMCMKCHCMRVLRLFH